LKKPKGKSLRDKMALFIHGYGFAGFSLSEEDIPLSQIIAKGKKTTVDFISTKIDGI
jgi:hypothetical protein